MLPGKHLKPCLKKTLEFIQKHEKPGILENKTQNFHNVMFQFFNFFYVLTISQKWWCNPSFDIDNYHFNLELILKGFGILGHPILETLQFDKTAVQHWLTFVSFIWEVPWIIYYMYLWELCQFLVS